MHSRFFSKPYQEPSIRLRPILFDDFVRKSRAMKLFMKLLASRLNTQERLMDKGLEHSFINHEPRILD